MWMRFQLSPYGSGWESMPTSIRKYLYKHVKQKYEIQMELCLVLVIYVKTQKQISN